MGMNGNRSDSYDDSDDGDLVPLGEALTTLELQREVARLARLVDALARHQGGTAKECPGCGCMVRVVDVVVHDEDLGHAAKRRVVLEDGTFQRHRKADRDKRPLCPAGC